MKIYLLSVDSAMTREWKRYFHGCPDVTVVNMAFHTFMGQYEVEGIATPGNSYGLMDGGYDVAVIDYFGLGLEMEVRRRIKKEWDGEQVVGTSLLVDIPGSQKKLLHTPSMRVPCPIKDPMVAYHCMRSTLLLAKRRKLKSVVIPAFGGSCGQLRPKTIAELMKEAYDQINNPPDEIDWEYALRADLESIE